MKGLLVKSLHLFKEHRNITGVGSEFRSWLKQKLEDIYSDIQNEV